MYFIVISRYLMISCFIWCLEIVITGFGLKTASTSPSINFRDYGISRGLTLGVQAMMIILSWRRPLIFSRFNAPVLILTILFDAFYVKVPNCPTTLATSSLSYAIIMVIGISMSLSWKLTSISIVISTSLVVTYHFY